MSRIILGLSLSGMLFLTLSAIPVCAQDRGGAPLSESNSGGTKEIIFEFSKAQKQVEEIEKTVAEKEKTGGAGAQEKAILREAKELLSWSKKSEEQAQDLKQQARRARNDAERQYLERRAADKKREARHFADIITGDNKPSSRPAESGGGAPAGGSKPARAGSGGGGVVGGPSGSDPNNLSGGGDHPRLRYSFGGVLKQLKEVEKRSAEASRASGAENIKQQAIDAFGAGRSGGGGVTLHVAASVDGIDPASVSEATILNDRLVLVLRDGKTVRFPEMSLDHLAVALRAVQGGEGHIEAELLADGREVVVLKTGKERFGDLAWRKSNLTPAYIKGELGRKVSLPIGPGFGLLSLPEPSQNRATYYGPVSGNDVGRIMLFADETIKKLWSGFDDRTGKPLPQLWQPLQIRDPKTGEERNLPAIKGFQTTTEMRARKQLAEFEEIQRALKEGQEAPKRPPRPQPDKDTPWWNTTVWYVWSPGEMQLELPAGGSELRFAKASMLLTAWSETEGNLDEEVETLATQVTKNFDQIAMRFPILEELRSLAKTVSVVRWLHKHNVRVDLTWAKARKLAPVETPVQVPNVTLWTDFRGSAPHFE